MAQFCQALLSAIAVWQKKKKKLLRPFLKFFMSIIIFKGDN